MMNSLTWWHRVGDPALARDMDELRRGAIWRLVILTGVISVAWHIVRVPYDGAADEVMAHSARQWGIFVVVMAGLALTAHLLWRRTPLASVGFLVTSTVSIITATWLLHSPTALTLVPLLVLVAALLAHPLAGLIVAAGALGGVLGLRESGPLAFVGVNDVVEAAVLSMLTLAIVWALGHIVAKAIEASSASQAEAWRHATEARVNRAELVQALKQLDLAYYRLQRANAALELAWKAADAAERSRSEFVTNISHELRTPLNLIIGFSEMILTAPESYGEPLPVAYRGDLNAVYRSAQHLLTLTNDVIDLARVGMDRLALTREPLDVAEIVADASAIVRDYIETKGLALRIAVAPGLPSLPADRLRLRQVLLNLLTNAARFTERGAITVSADLAGDWVRIAVADTGAGIPSDQLPRVFDEFYHDGGAQAPPTEQLGGIGLGLPLSKRLVELHGGYMGVESALGVGTSFWFALPVLAAGPTGVAPAPSPHRPVLGAAPERILVLVDADPQFLTFLQRHLAGYRIISAPDLAAAAAQADECQALAILADATTTSFAGFDLPVPLVSLPMPRNTHLGLTHGVVAHLIKPVARAALYETLRLAPEPALDVLVVDDDRRFARLLRRMLQTDPERRQHTVRTAYDGQTALALMRTARPGLVLLDLAMPGLDGAGVLTAMRAEPTLADVPVVIISAQDRLMEAFPLHGPLSVITPAGLGPEALLRTVGGLVDLLQPPRPAPSPHEEPFPRFAATPLP